VPDTLTMPTLRLYLSKYRDLGTRQPAAVQALLLWVALLTASLLAWPYALPVWQASGVSLALALLVGVGLLLLTLLPAHYPHRHFGWCNTVTFLRAAALCWLAGLWFAGDQLSHGPLAWGICLSALALLALDGVDGWLARRWGHASSFGARFDMEVDSFSALVLAVLVWQSGKLGAWVLLLGLFRPAFLLAGLAWPRFRRELPESLARKIVCVIQVAVLAVLLAPVVSQTAANILALLTLVLLTWSFARDTRWLLRQ
jgi:phosphatidylglycerophosphate synthase